MKGGRRLSRNPKLETRNPKEMGNGKENAKGEMRNAKFEREMKNNYKKF